MTALIGILNLTPDSFSDGGHYNTLDSALAHCDQLINDGASVIDIGAESTRPGATPLSADDEWARLSPILEAVITRAKERNVKTSLDTRHPSTAHAAINVGIDWINDVSCARDADMVATIAAAPHVQYVLMHSLSVPADKAITIPDDVSPTGYVYEALIDSIMVLEKAGIHAKRIIIDPGIGFGKNARQSLSLLWDMHALETLGCDILAGHSRKSCFALASDSPDHRDALTLLASAYLIHHNISYLRVHDVKAHNTLLQQLRG